MNFILDAKHESSAGLSKTLLDMGDIVSMMDAAEGPAKKRGAYKKASQ